MVGALNLELGIFSIQIKSCVVRKSCTNSILSTTSRTIQRKLCNKRFRISETRSRIATFPYRSTSRKRTTEPPWDNTSERITNKGKDSRRKSGMQRINDKSSHIGRQRSKPKTTPRQGPGSILGLTRHSQKQHANSDSRGRTSKKNYWWNMGS